MINSAMLVMLSTMAAPVPAAVCSGLADMSFPAASITSAKFVESGPYTMRQRRAEVKVDLPAHCSVSLVLAPSSDSHIEMDLWLPVNAWNGKFLAVGNGGWAGSISHSAMVSGLLEGYATASNDTGHKGANAEFAPGHPEKVVDFAHRAMHEMTMHSKLIIDTFYDQNLEYSYYQGCSTGGRQGLMAAQRYPDDFDAIIAGAPANPQIEKHAGDIQRNIEMLRRDAEVLSREKVGLAYRAAVSACDAQDGVEDGVISDPESCEYDPGVLQCDAGSDRSACLTPGQVETMRIGYAPMTSGKGEVIYDGYVPGTEQQWSFIGEMEPRGTALGTYTHIVFEDPSWDWKTFNVDRDLATGLERAGYINATPDLSAFKAQGGKLILYHGWVDGNIVPHNTINYYNRVLEKMGPQQDDWLRLFMVPGLAHCRGGEGPNQVNWLAALERWNETGTAPDTITAHRVRNSVVDMTRPLCPYPQIVKWSGVGSTNDAENFSCN